MGDVVSAVYLSGPFVHAVLSSPPATWQTPKHPVRPHSWSPSAWKLFLTCQAVTPPLGLPPIRALAYHIMGTCLHTSLFVARPHWAEKLVLSKCPWVEVGDVKEISDLDVSCRGRWSIIPK